MSDTARLLVADGAPDGLLDLELERLLSAGLDVTLNLWRCADPDAVRGRWAGRVRFVDIDGFDEAGLVAELTADGRGYDAFKTRANIPVRATLLEAVTRPDLDRRLRVVAQAGAGTDHVDTGAAARLGVAVTHTPGSNADAVAEFVLAQVLALTRNLVRHDEGAHRGVWRAVPVGRPPQLSELTLGVVGFGRIGRALASKARALGMTVRTTGRRLSDADARRHGVHRAPSLDALLADCDVLSLHVPLTPATRHLIGAAELARMRPGSVLVNTARGGVVDEQALADALRDPGHPVRAAAVDTFAREHRSFATPLAGLPNALLTPHVAGMTGEAMRTAALRSADHVVALLAGRTDGVPLVTPPPRPRP